MNIEKIKNIIFDFGGVVIDIDFQLSIDSYNRLGAKEFEKVYCQAKQTGIFDDLDKGICSPEEFTERVKQYLPQNVTKQQITDAWNDIIIGFPGKRISFLKKLKDHYFTIMLSNTNKIHYDVYIKDLRENFDCKNLNDLFCKAYLSFEIGMRKPDKEIFELVFNENNIKKDESLFIDDFKLNIEAAAALGIPSLWLKKGVDICDLFDGYKLKPEFLGEII